MQTLYPIIRRVRRPLVAVEPVTIEPAKPAVVAPVVEPAATLPVAEVVVPAEPSEPSHEKTSGKRHAR